MVAAYVYESWEASQTWEGPRKLPGGGDRGEPCAAPSDSEARKGATPTLGGDVPKCNGQ